MQQNEDHNNMREVNGIVGGYHVDETMAQKSKYNKMQKSQSRLVIASKGITKKKQRLSDTRRRQEKHGVIDGRKRSDEFVLGLNMESDMRKSPNDLRAMGSKDRFES